MVLTSDMERIETITRGDGFQIVLHTIDIKKPPTPNGHHISRLLSILATKRKVTDDHTARLIALPSEIRNKIYDLVLPNNTTISNAINGCIISDPGLLQVCHKFRDETRPIYFGRQRFIFGLALNGGGPLRSLEGVGKLCSRLGERVRFMRHLEVYVMKPMGEGSNWNYFFRMCDGIRAPLRLAGLKFSSKLPDDFWVVAEEMEYCVEVAKQQRPGMEVPPLFKVLREKDEEAMLQKLKK